MLAVSDDVLEEDAEKENTQNAANKTGGSTTEIAKKHFEESPDLQSSDDEIVHRKNKTVFQESSEDERDLVIDDEVLFCQPLFIDDEQQSKPTTLPESDPEQFLKKNLDSSGSEAGISKPRRKPKQFDSDSEPAADHESNGEMKEEVKRKKKTKKKKTKKRSSSGESFNGTISKSFQLTDDEDDDLLKDLDTHINEHAPDDEAMKGIEVKARSSCSDSDSSVGIPDDTHIVRKSEETDKTGAKKKKVYKEFNPEDWQNEEVHEKEYKQGDGKKEKKKKVYREFINPEDWQNEAVHEKEYEEGDGKKEKKKRRRTKKEYKEGDGTKEYKEGDGTKEYKEGDGTKEKKKKETLDPVAQLVSERQRMMRETEISLPRHEPAPLLLSDCLARIPKLTAPRPRVLEDKKPTFVPRLSSKNDDFFLPKDLGNFMNRFKKHLSLSAKVGTDEGPPNCAQTVTTSKQSVPKSVLIKKQLQTQLKDQILAKKVEARKAAEMEKLIDEEFRTVEDPDDAELQKILDNDEEEELSDSDQEQDEEEVEVEVEEAEDVDEKTDRRAEKILLGEDVSSSSGEEEEGKEDEKERKYHSDTDSDLLASADEVHVRELAASSASEDDALQPSRYSLRRLTRYCRKKRIKRQRRHHQKVAIGSESEKEEKAKKKLQALLKRREEIKKKIYAKKAQRAENSCTSIQDLFGRGSLCLTGISRVSDSQSLPGSTSREVQITRTIIPDSMDTLPVSEKTFDVDTAVRNVVEDSQFIEKSQADFLPPDEDAVFLDTQGMLRSGLDTSGEGGIEALGGGGGGGLGSQPLDMLNLCSGGFNSTAPDSGESGGRVTVQDISFNLTRSPDIIRSGLSQTPISKRRDPAAQSPLTKGLSQTPLTRFGTLQGVLSQESEDEEEEDNGSRSKGKKRRALYSDMLDGEAEKSGSDHSDDEYEDENDEYDTSMLAKDSELPSDEEELAAQLKQVYHDQQALDEKEEIKRLKERFIQEEQGFFRTRKFRGEDSNIDIFSSNLGLDFEDEDVDTSAETYKSAMEKRAERMKKEQFVKEKRKKEALSGAVDEDSQAFLDSLQDITDSNSRSAFTSSQQCGSFLKHTTGTLSRLSSITSSSLNSDKTSSRSYVFQTVSPGQNKRKRSGQAASDPKRHKQFINSTQSPNGSTDSKQRKSIFNVIK